MRRRAAIDVLRGLAAAVLSWVLSAQAHAGLGSVPYSSGLAEVTKGSEIIAIGKASIRPEDQAKAGGRKVKEEWCRGFWEIARLDAGRILKGKPEQKTVFVQTFHCEMAADWRFWMTPVPVDRRCLLFLEMEDNEKGIYRILDPCPPLLLAPEPPEGIEKADLRGVLDAELARAVDTGDPEIAGPAADAIGELGLSGEKPMAALGRMSRSDKPHVCAQGLAIRIKLADKTALVEFRELLQAGKFRPEETGGVAAEIRSAHPPDWLPELAAFFDVPQVRGGEPERLRERVFLRESVAYAIRVSKAGAAHVLPILVRILDEENLEVRYNAVAGMGEQTGMLDPEWRPTVDDFIEDPQPYVARWKEWWQLNKAKYEAGKTGPVRPVEEERKQP